jgi:hypothetical protein
MKTSLNVGIAPGGLLVIASVLAASACGAGFDRSKFEDAVRSATLARQEINTTGGVGVAMERLVTALDADIAVLATRVETEAERQVLESLLETSSALAAFARFRFLDADAVDGRLLALGTNVALVEKYGLSPVEKVDAGVLVESGAALKTTLAAVDRHLADVIGRLAR